MRIPRSRSGSGATTSTRERAAEAPEDRDFGLPKPISPRRGFGLPCSPRPGGRHGGVGRLWGTPPPAGPAGGGAPGGAQPTTRGGTTQGTACPDVIVAGPGVRRIYGGGGAD